MHFNGLFFVLLLTCLCLAVAQGSYDDCCYNYVPEVKRGIKRLIVNFRIQEMDGGCNLHATVFVLKKGRFLCGNPSEKWVKDQMRKIKKIKKWRQQQQAKLIQRRWSE